MVSYAIKGVLRIIVCASVAVLILGMAKACAFDKRLSSSLSHFIMASMYEQEGQIEASIKEYQATLRIDQRNSFVHLNLALSYLKNNETSKAIDELKLAIEYAPDSIEPHALLALIYFSQNQGDIATAEYEQALKNASKLEPANIDIYKSLGLVYLRQRRFQDAINTYRLILDLSPADAQAHFYLATIYDAQKDHPAAVKELEQAVELKPDYDEALNYLGYVYVEENRNLQKAEAMIKKAVTIDPANGAYVDSLGWLYYKQGKLKESLKELLRASSLLDDPVIFDHLGQVYFKLNDKENAKVNWEKSLTLDPGQDKVKRRLESLSQPRQ